MWNSLLKKKKEEKLKHRCICSVNDQFPLYLNALLPELNPSFFSFFLSFLIYILIRAKFIRARVEHDSTFMTERLASAAAQYVRPASAI